MTFLCKYDPVGSVLSINTFLISRIKSFQLAAKAKFYAVCVGRGGPKIYNTWDECKEKVTRFPGAKHRSFATRVEAENWLAGNITLMAPAQEPMDAEMPFKPQDIPSIPVEDAFAANDDYISLTPGVSLSPEQNEVLRRVEEGHSVFFTGSAGSGKSVLLREIIRKLRGLSRTVAITASTGIAAINIGGTTLHSWAGIGLGQESEDQVVGKFFGQKKFEPVLDRWTDVETLVIDEISMIDGSLFDKLESIARQLRHKNLPFGGIQLILSGDFYQLPPVPGRTDKGVQIPPIFAFDAKSWNSCVGRPVTLTKVFRQKDPAFIDMLNAMRFGGMSPEAVRAFQKLSRPVTYTDGIEPTELFPTRQEVEYSNSTKLRELKTESHIYQASQYAGVNSRGERVTYAQMENILERLVVPKKIELKIGAQVMLVKNMKKGVLVNGSVGQVIKFSTPQEAIQEHTEIATIERNGEKQHIPPNQWPVVRFINGSVVMCVPQEFTVNNADGEMEARRDQVPLILAWALSVHKSQGQTLERTKVDLRRTFEKGQAYVAISRATSMDTLQVLNFDVTKVMAHPRVLAWDRGDTAQRVDIYSDENDIDEDEAMAAYYDM